MPNEQSSTPLTYWDYIATDELMSLQKPLTDAHDELQFIIVHQTFELWFKLAIYEMRAAIEALDAGDVARGTRYLKRVASILRTSLMGFDPLMTMSQQGYAEFRDALHPASGFQSSQFRVIEILMGIERVTNAEEEEKERFYWENAVQAGVTFTHFMTKYHEDLVKSYEDVKKRNLRRVMLRLTEEATGKSGADAYRALFGNRDAYPELMALAETGRDLQQAMLDFRLHHHKVTVFTVGEHAPGTSDAHKPSHPSCAAYLLGVIRDRSTIFPELETALTGSPA
jgi:tryptophan 2,3-dioxygenase